MDLVYFYSQFFLILFFALGIIFAPRMYLAVLSLFALICTSTLLLLDLNAYYIGIFQTILCAFILCFYIFLLLKKTERLTLKLKLASKFKVVFSVFILILFISFCCIFFVLEFDGSLYEFFNIVAEKSFDAIEFNPYKLPLILLFILITTVGITLRAFLNDSEMVKIDDREMLNTGELND